MDRRRFLSGVGAAWAAAVAGPVGASRDRVLGTSCDLDPDDPLARKDEARDLRIQAAEAEWLLEPPSHPCNGDEDLYPSRIGNFSKSLPHDDLGEVDPAAYDALLAALDTGLWDDFEAVPTGGRRALANPMGGRAFTFEGADSPAVGVANPPPALASAEFAAQLAELYWMAVLRELPFDQYESHVFAQRARADLAAFSGYTGPRDPITGEIRASDLFRVDYPGVLDGPMASQFLLLPFTYDGAQVNQLLATGPALGDYLTTFDEWLEAQRGFPGGPAPRELPATEPRHVFNGRKLGQHAGSDMIITAYMKALLIIQATFGPDAQDPANPYRSSQRQSGFATFGGAHAVELLGKVHKSERSCWYQKWNVHRFLRPEAAGGRVHNVMSGAAEYPLHPDLLESSQVLDVVFEYNRRVNRKRLGLDEGSWLLPQLFNVGGPTHPSFPAGHATTAGACVTMLKAWYDESLVIPQPMKPTPDGRALEPYVPGVDGPELTVGGELNKLAHNLSWGRDMSGVHWRADNVEGNHLGEEIALRILAEEKVLFAEPFSGFSLTRFDGTPIVV